MSFGAFLTREDGTPFYIQDTTPLALVRRQTFSIDATVNSGSGQRISLDAVGALPYLYFIRFDQTDGWGYQTTSDGVHGIVVGAFSSGVVSGTIYVFGAVAQPIPAWGIAIYDSTGKCILTNETRVLAGVDIVNPTGSPGTAGYLNENYNGKFAIVPGRCGAIIYSTTGAAGSPVTQVITQATGCYWNGSVTSIKANPMGRSSASIPVSQSKGSGYAPAYIDCTKYE